MKLHRPIIEGLVRALVDTFIEGHQADRVLERAFKANRAWGARDRRFIAENFYDIVRFLRLNLAIAGINQLTTTSEVWQAIGVHFLRTGQVDELPSAPEWKNLNIKELRSRLSRITSLAVLQSYPDWLWDRLTQELGAPRWNEIAVALNHQAPVVLRANRLKTTRDALQKSLREEDTESVTVSELPDALVLKERKNVFAANCFKDGWFEVQDGNSQKIAPLLQVQPGHRVIDACAGAGGKSLHLAALMKNKGKLIALDVIPRKLEELKKRSVRAGCDIIEARPIDSSKVLKRLENSADALLLDVPCSGLGVLRRNPDSKWKITEEELVRLNGIQTEILMEYPKMLKVGGRLVYATCSILPSENEKQVEKFLQAKGDQFRLESQTTFWPSADGFDGFFAAVLTRLK